MTVSNGFGGGKAGVADGNFATGGPSPAASFIGPLIESPINEATGNQSPTTPFSSLPVAPGAESDAIGFWWLCPRGGVQAFYRARIDAQFTTQGDLPGVTALLRTRFRRRTFKPSADSSSPGIQDSQIVEFDGIVHDLAAAGTFRTVQTWPSDLGMVPPKLEVQPGDMLFVDVRIVIVAGAAGSLDAVLEHGSPDGSDQAPPFVFSLAPLAESNVAGFQLINNIGN